VNTGRKMGQLPASRSTNIAFFRDHRLAYDKGTQALDSYTAIRGVLT
jgi:hypothetical protein